MNDLDRLRQAARAAIAARGALRDAWRAVSSEERVELSGSEDLALMQELFKSRIDVENAFEVLVRVSERLALSALLSRYLGTGVDPDTKFGGYAAELDTMIDDLVEIRGRTALARLLAEPDLDRRKLEDPRVLEAMRNALDLEEDDDVLGIISEIRD